MLDQLRRQVMLHWERHYLDYKLPKIFEITPNIAEATIFAQGLEEITIQQPIFIVGCHRSGTTILYDTLAQHPDLAYFTNASALLPKTPIFSNWFSKNIIGDATVERFVQDGLDVSPGSPSEGIRIWELYADSQDSHYLDETYNNDQMEAYLKKTIKKHLKYFQATRFINKNPDNSTRIRYLNKLFPDAYFIHIIRDGRAVCHSLLKFRKAAADFFGADHRHATSGVKGGKWLEIKKLWDSDPIQSIGLLWLDVMETLERDRELISSHRYLEVRYEDFVAEPFSYLQKLIQFSDLSWDPAIAARFQGAVHQINLGSRNDAWKQHLTPQEIEKLMAMIGPKMQQYGYVVD